jgi:hypothetical protein
LQLNNKLKINKIKLKMKKIIFSVAIVTFSMNIIHASLYPIVPSNTVTTKAADKIDIKIKNDTDEAITVINAGSGGTYRLQKNIVTTIKMDDGDKLYIYDGGKKGRLLLTASSELVGKVQIYSKL